MNAPELPNAESARLPFVSVEARRATLSLLEVVGAFESDAKGNWNFVNSHLCELLGVPASSLLGREWIKMIHPDDVQRAVAEYKQARDSGRSWHQELRLVRFDGSNVPVRIDANPLPQDPDAKGVSYVGVVTDMTTQMRSLAIAEEAGEAVQAMMDVATEGIWIHRNRRIIAANQASAVLVGYESWQDVIGMDVLDFVSDEDRASFAIAATSSEFTTTVGRLVRRDGTEFLASVRGRPTMYAGAPARIGAMLAMDSQPVAELTARRLAAQLDAMDKRLTLPHSRVELHDGVPVLISANQAYADLVGRPLSEIPGLPMEVVAPRELNIAQWESYEEMLATGSRPPSFEITYLRPDGSTRKGMVYAVDYQDPVTTETYSMSFVVPL